MEDQANQSDAPAVDSAPHSPWARYIPLASWLVTIIVLLLIPFKIVGYGFTPGGDARRHVAQPLRTAPSRKSSSCGPAIRWITVRAGLDLEAIARACRLGQGQVDELFAGGLDVCVLFAPLPWLRRPEAWLAALLAELVALPELMTRFSQARPYLFTEALCMIVLLIWSRRGPKSPTWWQIGFTTVAIALSTWVHGTWYLWVLPVAAFYFAQWWPAALSLTCCWLAGAVGGAILTGQPFAFLKQAVFMIFSIYHEHTPAWMLVGELNPSYGEFATLILLAIVFLWRRQPSPCRFHAALPTASLDDCPLLGSRLQG